MCYHTTELSVANGSWLDLSIRHTRAVGADSSNSPLKHRRRRMTFRKCTMKCRCARFVSAVCLAVLSGCLVDLSISILNFLYSSSAILQLNRDVSYMPSCKPSEERLAFLHEHLMPGDTFVKSDATERAKSIKRARGIQVSARKGVRSGLAQRRTRRINTTLNLSAANRSSTRVSRSILAIPAVGGQVGGDTDGSLDLPLSNEQLSDSDDDQAMAEDDSSFHIAVDVPRAAARPQRGAAQRAQLAIRRQMQELDDSRYFIIERIVDEQVLTLEGGSIRHYLIKWKGFSSDENTYERADVIDRENPWVTYEWRESLNVLDTGLAPLSPVASDTSYALDVFTGGGDCSDSV